MIPGCCKVHRMTRNWGKRVSFGTINHRMTSRVDTLLLKRPTLGFLYKTLILFFPNSLIVQLPLKAPYFFHCKILPLKAKLP
jgi:hypothetical protein